MIELIARRHDGTFVALVNGLPYHVVRDDEPLWSEASEAAEALGRRLKFDAEPAAPPEIEKTKLDKAVMWRRCTNPEAEAIATALAAAPMRLQMIFRDCAYLDTADPDYPDLRAGILAALGGDEDRVAAILEPDY